MEPLPRILFIDDEPKLCKNMQALLAREGCHVDVAENGNAGLRLLSESTYDLVITDVVMPDVSGMDIVRYVRDFLPDTIAIVITGHATLEGAVVAMRQGAYDYVTKPIDFDFLKISVERALERSRLARTIKEYTESLEQKVRERTSALEEAQAQLIQTEKLAAIGELATRVAHEIKNPLISIGGLARVLDRKAEDAEKTREIAAVIQEEVARLERILKTLLQLRQDQELQIVEVAVPALLGNIVQLLAPKMEDLGIDILWDMDPEMPGVCADEDKLKQVFLNLCQNAVHAMPGGGSLTLRGQHHAEGVQVEIADTGYGIPPEHTKKIFSPFFTTKEQGTGLGLSICEKIVRDHGGRISVRSEAGRGTTARIWLPLEAGEKAPPTAAQG